MDQITDRFAGFSEFVNSVEDFREIMGHPKDMVKAKVIDHLSDICRDFIHKSPFMLIGSSNKSGRCEVSPKGDPAGFVHVLDEKHLVIPDRPGNKLAATFTNLVENPYVGLIFLIPGKTESLRVTGEARIVRDQSLRETLAVDGKVPEFAIVVYVEHAEIHCPKCMLRSKLWEPDNWLGTEGLANIAEANIKHGKLDMTPDELREIAVKEGLNKLY